jgi:hypothetical protein
VRAQRVLIAVIHSVCAVACSSSGAPLSTATPTAHLATPFGSIAVNATGRPTNQWYGQVQAALFSAPGLPGHISTTYIDGANDQIVIGVDTEDAQRAAEQEIAKLGLPPDAVKVIIRGFAIPN